MNSSFFPFTFRRALLNWFDEHGRKDLPWQKKKTAYRVWLSEIMLQQTQVKTVLPYFKRFVRRFPTIKALAAADVDEVLQLWAGLGYYARARNLHRSAQIITEQYRGRFPNDLNALQTLPGIGRSTAGAILSIAFNEQAAILDGNVKRVLTRILALPGYPGDPKVNEILWIEAERLTPKDRVADYTQAIMDLGATLCTRRKARCPECPVQTFCKAHQQNQVEIFPEPKAKKTRPTKTLEFILLENERGEIILNKRKSPGIWGGLWCLPEYESTQDLEAWCKNSLAQKVLKQQALPEFTHILTHFTLQIKVCHVKSKTLKGTHPSLEGPVWHLKSELGRLGFPAPIQKLLETHYHVTFDPLH